MFFIDDIMVSDEVLEEYFCCDLSHCKGGCCEDGDAGAPIEKDEMNLIDENYPKIEYLLSEDAKKEIKRKGKYVFNEEFGWVTPTLGNDNEICVYGIRDENNIIKCAFEIAFNNKKINWQKPVSCHLFPLIAEKRPADEFETLNFQPREKLCAKACKIGVKEKISLIEFVKEPIIRKYGEKFFAALQYARDGK